MKIDIAQLSLPGFAVLLAVLVAVVFVRYLLVSGTYHILIVRMFGKKYERRIVDPVRADNRQMLTEIYWSALSALIFAITGLAVLMLWEGGYTAVYSDLRAFPLWYLPLSVLLVLVIQDTYYYWIHRWMHRPRIYRLLHKVHHDSIHTSVFTAFSFHPLETVLQAVILPLLVFVLPLHLYAILAVLIIMTISATINHAAIEIYPAGWERNWITKWLIGSTHHDQHHKSFRTNYGLYFTFWDKMMGTESPRYEEKFREAVRRE